MRNKYRIKGINNEIGKVVYLHYIKHQNQTFYKLSTRPPRYKYVDPKEYMELQFIAQSILSHVTWECNDPAIKRRYNIATK